MATPSNSGFLPVVTQADKVYSVTEINILVKQILEDTVDHVWVEGEISKNTLATSGHRYLSIKDDGAVLDCAIWKNTVRLDFKPDLGLRVRAYGHLSVYPPRGSYQLIITQLVGVGIGPLEVAFQKMKEKLLKEGLFDESHKRILPQFPERIGVVTSPTGAVIQDIRRTIASRFPGLEIVLHPAKVQGEGAKEDIVAGIEALNQRDDLDVLIVGRGGGSLEDLWAFNEEVVARAIYNSRIPIISAVGHEVDVTIADFVADLRAATPTMAAQIVTEGWVRVKGEMPILQKRFERAMQQFMNSKSQRLERLKMSHALRRPADLFLQWSQRVDETVERMTRAVQQELRHETQRVQGISDRLLALSPENVLQRGYSITRKVGDPKALRDANQVKAGEKLETKLADGTIISTAE
jgi:exodeoxyribonuclease VII large subunit